MKRPDQLSMFSNATGFTRLSDFSVTRLKKRFRVIAHGVDKNGCAGARNMSERMDGEAAALPPE
jgi:hypothetical protein